jgi:hypothetical protein
VAPRQKPAHDGADDPFEPLTVRFPINVGGMTVEVEVRTVTPRFVLEKPQAAGSNEPVK